MLGQWLNFKEKFYTEKASWDLGVKSIYLKLFLCTKVNQPMPYFLDFLFVVRFNNNYKFLVKLTNWMKRLL